VWGIVLGLLLVLVLERVQGLPLMSGDVKVRKNPTPNPFEDEDDEEYENDSAPYKTSRLRNRLTKARMAALGSPRR
jgi:hypothetical protein